MSVACGGVARAAFPDWLVMLAAALIIGYSAINMFKKAFKLRRLASRPPGTDAAASPSTQSSGAPEGSRTEVRVASGDRPNLGHWGNPR